MAGVMVNAKYGFGHGLLMSAVTTGRLQQVWDIWESSGKEDGAVLGDQRRSLFPLEGREQCVCMEEDACIKRSGAHVHTAWLGNLE